MHVQYRTVDNVSHPLGRCSQTSFSETGGGCAHNENGGVFVKSRRYICIYTHKSLGDCTTLPVVELVSVGISPSGGVLSMFTYSTEEGGGGVSSEEQNRVVSCFFHHHPQHGGNTCRSHQACTSALFFPPADACGAMCYVTCGNGGINASLSADEGARPPRCVIIIP